MTKNVSSCLLTLYHNKLTKQGYFPFFRFVKFLYWIKLQDKCFKSALEVFMKALINACN